MYFMKDKDLPEEGLEKAELQLLFFKQSFNNYITQMIGQIMMTSSIEETLTTYLTN